MTHGLPRYRTCDSCSYYLRWHLRSRVNYGRGRVIPKQRTNGIKIHRSVQIRMQHLNYIPKPSINFSKVQWIDWLIVIPMIAISSCSLGNCFLDVSKFTNKQTNRNQCTSYMSWLEYLGLNSLEKSSWYDQLTDCVKTNTWTQAAHVM